VKAVGDRDVGARGEELACRYLKRRGYRILVRNYRSPFGELDIVAARGGKLIFCEVKARRGGGMGEVLEAVDAGKKKRIIRTALHYLAEKGGGARECRFDVIAFLFDGKGWRMDHVQDAFEVGEL
jgi:putative endonuclease